jgi:hypothetical protein
MNRFVANKSKILLIFAWVFIIAHFADAVNLTDLFPGTTTIHFEEGDGILTADQMYSENFIQINSSNAGNLAQKYVSSSSRHYNLNFIILDQDSPSLAATSVNSTVSFLPIPREAQLFLPWNLSTESLYLQNRTLLL